MSKRVLVLGPLGRPAPHLARAARRAGALGSLDVQVVEPQASFTRDDRAVFAVITHPSQLEWAEEAGVDALIARGHSAGGSIGEDATPILLQRLKSKTNLPIWCQGGIGIHTSAAAIALGAIGVVLEDQLALFEEAGLSEEIRGAISAMDGSETAIVDGRRVYDRPGPLREARLEVAQHACFAKSFRTRFKRIADVVRGVESAIDTHLGQAYATRPLAPDSPLARDHGIRYPIAQGPMTRVSDRAGFALAVAEGGGLPFLALSLVRGESLETLLTETAAALEGRTWGVGMLGFAPPELREHQLAAVRRARPTVALLAGGRPAQARELEEDGIPTYLHVPSPGLLDLFLKDGARRFVFEGRECGGHVGPRTSFVLWEQFVERLLAFDQPETLSVLFAGGIHDADSAAAVSAIAAPLAVRGAKVGVLMGTAYLYTEEAVQSGAITSVFQEAAIGCADTSLVHTAPGHATRCASSPFVDAFEARKAELIAADTPSDAMWEELERLNLGRLRIASKGIVRNGDQLEQVDAATQRDEGMFMIGQVASLHERTTTIEDLHRDVSEGSTERLQPPESTEGTPADVAIIGMAGFFPDAEDLEAYWNHIVLGRDVVREVDPSRWDPDLYFDPEDRTGTRAVSKWGGFLPPIDFDPLEYGIPPRSLPAVDPVQLLALHAAQHALQDAGYGDGGFDRERASVIFGAEAGTDLASAYGFRAQYPQYLGELPPELDAHLPTLTEDSFPGVLANVIAGRIANRLDLGGVNYTVDAACASSLAAVDLACKELRAGTSDLVLAGGADLHNAIGDFLLFSSVHALSRTGRSRPFDSEADGIALGEAVAVVVCKRLEDAERDGDRIYAVIKGIAGSSDGKSLGLTAPRKDGQKRALSRAYKRAGVTPRDVGLAEAHGTGTVVGDRTELATLTETFSGAGARPSTVTLGSVKSNVGHTKCAAGIAGLIKCALSLHRQILPPTLHIRSPNPGWNRHTSPFVFRGRAAPWPGEKRHAAVSAFGFGGTNFHCVLASHDTDTTIGMRDFPAELFLLREVEDIARIRRALDAGHRLVDIAASLRGQGPLLFAVVAESADDLREKLDAIESGENGRGVFPYEPTDGKLAFLFPGQGSQAPGMLAELFVAFPWLQDGLSADWADRIYPGDAWEPAHRKSLRSALTDTRVAQPALGIVDLAAAKLLEALGVRADMMAGHSYGELVALTVAGALPESELTRLSTTRGELILAAAGDDPGTMAAVKAPAEPVREALAAHPHVVLANLNSPTQTVISGPTEAIRVATEDLESNGFEVKSIPVAAAFHSPVVAEAANTLAAVLSNIEIHDPDRPVYANSTAAPYVSGDVLGTLASQVARPVRFAESVEAMAEAGARIFVEVGPGRVLTRITDKVLGDRVLARSVEDKKGGGALYGLIRLLASLAAAGVELDTTKLFEGRARPFDLDAPEAKASVTAWKLDGYRAVPVHGELPDFALRPPPEKPFAVSGAGSRDAVVLDYLETLRQQAETQRKVMLAYLGDVAAPATELPALLTEAAPLPTEAVPLSNQAPREVLLEVVSERTGYPVEMLDIDLDLEADLSIDSIKRIEILGVVAQRLGVDAGDAGSADVVEQLSGVKTLRGIIDWLEEDNAGSGPEFARFVSQFETLAAPEPNSLSGRRIGFDPGDTQLGEALHQALSAQGARVVQLEEPDEDFDSVVLVAGLGTDADEALGDRLWSLAQRSAAALGAGASELVIVTGGGGLENPTSSRAWSAGVSGLVKSLNKEFDATVRRIDLDAEADLADLVGYTVSELGTDGPVEVEWRNGTRRARSYVSFPLENDPLALSREAVVLLTGGARGITARMAIAFAERFACTVVLLGRSPAPDAEDAATAGLETAVELRKHLITTGLKPAEIESKVRRIQANRQMRQTFEAIEATGARWAYHAVDVRDPAAIDAVVRQTYTDFDRIDWVIHGAGVNEDKFLKDKTEESFRRVFDTKVDGARNLLNALKDDVEGIAFFSSVAAAFGNRGQTDYAAANDVLDQMARSHAKAVSVAWGPWAGGGMVDEALERQYAELGIGLIPPDAGVDAFFRELASGARHAVWMSATPEDMS